MNIFQLLIDHKEALGAAAGLMYEIIVRLKPTAKDWSIINILKQAFDFIPNKKSDGSLHTTGTEPNAAKEVTQYNGSAGGPVPVIILVCLVALMGCAHKIAPVKTVIKDSIITKVETRLKDTTIFIPGADIQFHDTIPCPDFSLYNLRSAGNLTASVNLTKGVLSVDCKADSLRQIIQWLDSEITTLRTTVTTVTLPGKTVTVTQYRTPLWCWLLVAGCLIYLYIKLKPGIGNAAGWLIDKFKN